MRGFAVGEEFQHLVELAAGHRPSRYLSGHEFSQMCGELRPSRVNPRSSGLEHFDDTIYADELQPGGLVEYDGCAHLMTHVDRCRGEAWPVASDDTGWAIALGHNLIAVRRIA